MLGRKEGRKALEWWMSGIETPLDLSALDLVYSLI